MRDCPFKPRFDEIDIPTLFDFQFYPIYLPIYRYYPNKLLPVLQRIRYQEKLVIDYLGTVLIRVKRKIYQENYPHWRCLESAFFFYSSGPSLLL